MGGCQTGQHRTIQEFAKVIHVYDKGMPLKWYDKGTALGEGVG